MVRKNHRLVGQDAWHGWSRSWRCRALVWLSGDFFIITCDPPCQGFTRAASALSAGGTFLPWVHLRQSEVEPRINICFLYFPREDVLVKHGYTSFCSVSKKKLTSHSLLASASTVMFVSLFLPFFHFSKA